MSGSDYLNMSEGIPEIASNFPLWIEIIVCNVSCSSVNPTAVAEAIDTFVNNPEMAHRMGENSLCTVWDKCNLAIEEQRLLVLKVVAAWIFCINHYAGGPLWGMEYRPYYLAREWVRAGHLVTVVAASHSHVRARQPETGGAWTKQHVDGINYVWCKTPSYQGNGVGRVINILTFLVHLRFWRRWLRQKPDIVIASSTYPADIAAARCIAKFHRAKLIWEVHDLWPRRQ